MKRGDLKLNKFIISCILLLITTTISAQAVKVPTPGSADICTMNTQGTDTVKQENPNETLSVSDQVINSNQNEAIAWNQKVGIRVRP